MLTREELLNLDYAGSSAAALGMTAEDYRAQYRLHGRPIRWWKAMEVPRGETGPNGEAREQASGRCYVEQTQALNGTPLGDIRVMLWNTRRSVQNSAGAWVRVAETEVGALPDEVVLSTYDRIALTDVAWDGEQIITRGAVAADVFINKPVVAIDSIVAEGQAINPAIYTVSDSGVTWNSGAAVADIAALRAVNVGSRTPGQARVVTTEASASFFFDEVSEAADNAATILRPSDVEAADPGRWIKINAGIPLPGSKYNVKYRYHPVWWCPGDERGIVHQGTDNKFLPQRVQVQLLHRSGRETT